ncbi:MAG TPA: hypothetical protein VHZ07_15755 [Bryobacteraceae bacterium]|jgi:hypothetical protein|nr:hypothetical protein [Bryobacteraceae bacterium]
MRDLSRIALLIVAASLSLLHAQGTKTRNNPAKYGAHVKIGSVGLGADLWGHFIPLEGETLKADSYLVVEVALFASPNIKVDIDPGQFVLKVNGQRILPNSPGLVTLGFVDSDMRERGPRLIADGQIGSGDISVGRDPTQPKFPGDSNPADIPPPRRTQTTDNGLQKEPIDPVKAVDEASLPEGAHATPISGYLFYPWRGKLKRVKHVEIEYTSTLGSATLTLR